MERGDLSNEIAPKLFFVIEGLIVHHDAQQQKRAAKLARKGKWRDLASLYDPDGMMLAHLWDLVWRTPYSHDLVTIASGHEDWLDALEQRLDRFNVPYASLLGFDGVDALAQRVVFMPNILRLYHGDPEWNFRFGRVGEYVGDPQVFGVS